VDFFQAGKETKVNKRKEKNKALAQVQLLAKMFVLFTLSLSMFGEKVEPFICSIIPLDTPT
jgi:hypothetical protein